MPESTPLTLTEAEVVLTREGDGPDAAFHVVWEGQPIGRVELLVDGSGDADLVWAVVPEYRELDVVVTALRLALDWGFEHAHLHRIQALVPVTRHVMIRHALRAGLRAEGTLRGLPSDGGARSDTCVLARLRSDAEPDSREGFIAILNSRLPTKRAIAQGLLRNELGAVLLCRLTYKREWDLPGGVVDASESPREAVRREIQEELGLRLAARRLSAVNWLPPWRGWDDAVLFLFDLGVVDADILGRVRLERREIREVRWVPVEELDQHVAPYTAEMVRHVVDADGGGARATAPLGTTAYLENSRAPVAPGDEPAADGDQPASG